MKSKISFALGAPFKVGGYTVRWCENPEDVGLRLVGFADKVAQSIRHTGWFCDDDCSEKTRGVVFRLPSRGGVDRFMAAGSDPNQDGPVYLETCIYGDEIEAARAADALAEAYAEKERDYQEAWRAGRDAAELQADANMTRAELLAILVELRPYRKAADCVSAICTRLRQDVESMRATMVKYRDKRDKLLRDWRGNDVFEESYAEGV